MKDFDNLNFYSYIVFSERCELKNITLTSGNHCVVKRNDLLVNVSRNASKMDVNMTSTLVDEIYKKLYPLTQVDEAKKKAHIENIEKHYKDFFKVENTTELSDKKCPRCGGKLVLRMARNGDFGGNKFYGCSNYPKCRYIENIEK